jgi:hypothetical protein
MARVARIDATRKPTRTSTANTPAALRARALREQQPKHGRKSLVL